MTMLHKFGTAAFAALSLFVVLASGPQSAHGQATPAGKAHAKCVLRCNGLFQEQAEACGNGKCHDKCQGPKANEDACKSCTEECMAPKKQEVTDCMKKCPAPK